MDLGRLTRRTPVRYALAVNARYGRDGGGYLAAAITYFGFLSLFPLLLLALSAIGFALDASPRAQATWSLRLASAIPGLGPLVGDNIRAVVNARAGTGLVGLAGLLWSGTGATQAAGHALSRIFDVPQYSGLLRTKVWSIGSTIALGLLAIAGVAVAGVTGGAAARDAVGALAPVGAFVLVFALDFVLFLAAYRLLAQRPGPPFMALWPGALLAATGWSLLKVIGAWYAARTVTSSTAVYGAFASVVGVLVLLYLASRLFLYGAELNVVLSERLGGGHVKEQPAARPEGGSPAQGANGQSTPELVRSIAVDVGTLVRKEVELAKQEVLESVTARAKAAAAMAGAGLLALVVLAFLGLAAATALDSVLPGWASRLIVAGAFLVVVGGAAAFGLRRVQQPPLKPEETVRTVKEDVEWAKAQLKR